MLSSRFAVGVHVLAVLALRPDELLTSTFIAASVNTNPVVVRRLLGLLQRAGLVEARTGPGGGARLARDARSIRLREVFRAMESGELLSLHHSRPNPACPVGRNIQAVLAGVFGSAERAFERALDRTSLADVASSIQRCGEPGA